MDYLKLLSSSSIMFSSSFFRISYILTLLSSRRRTTPLNCQHFWNSSWETSRRHKRRATPDALHIYVDVFNKFIVIKEGASIIEVSNSKWPERNIMSRSEVVLHYKDWFPIDQADGQFERAIMERGIYSQVHKE